MPYEGPGLARGGMRLWIRRVEGTEGAAWTIEEPLPPAIRILDLEHDLNELKREVEQQAITIQILESKRAGSVNGRGAAR